MPARIPCAPGKAAAWFPLVGAALGAAGAGIYLAAARALPGFPGRAGLRRLLDRCQRSPARRRARRRSRRVARRTIAREHAGNPQGQPHRNLRRGRRDPEHAGPMAGAAIFHGSEHCSPFVSPRRPFRAPRWWAWRGPRGRWEPDSATRWLRPCGRGCALVALAQGVARALSCGLRAGAVIVAGIVPDRRALARRTFINALGGVNGDCLGATEQLIEIFILGLFACAVCSW